MQAPVLSTLDGRPAATAVSPGVPRESPHAPEPRSPARRRTVGRRTRRRAILAHRARDRASRRRHRLPRPRRRRRLVTSPGQVLDSATVVIRNGVITAVGKNAGRRPARGSGTSRARPSTRASSNARSDLGMDAVPQGGDVGPTHGNSQVRAWFSTTASMKDDSTRRVALRSLGFGAALAVPKQGIFRGTASVVNLGGAAARSASSRRLPAGRRLQPLPSSSAGCIPTRAWGPSPCMRQTFMDAEWYIRANAAYEASGRSVLPPERSKALRGARRRGAGRAGGALPDRERGGVPPRLHAGQGLQARAVVPRQRRGPA